MEKKGREKKRKEEEKQAVEVVVVVMVVVVVVVVVVMALQAFKTLESTGGERAKRLRRQAIQRPSFSPPICKQRLTMSLTCRNLEAGPLRPPSALHSVCSPHAAGRPGPVFRNTLLSYRYYFPRPQR
ncbi:hypothetical protein E2C01_073693 [Portunus trituberculatus]|uniref:Uncharacterized protein n=1 Tax=Portunus trituberculatus TaxID=210409 RepID=A0A5B7IB91_PORTR|nr:hypothetical protein [Portunus trituberculatus]